MLILLGESSLEHPMGVSYEDAGAQAVDRFDGEVEVLVVERWIFSRQGIMRLLVKPRMVQVTDARSNI